MYCKFCGREIEENLRFCPYCGKKLIEDDNVLKEEKIESYLETNKILTITKILFVLTGIGIIISFIPYWEILPLFGVGYSLLLFLINLVIFIKERSKYNMLMLIINIVLVLTNINSIILYSILK